jgi:hypothetical protein
MRSELDDVARRLISDPVNFKISMAKHFLEKIPKKMPESNLKRMALEADIDSFLFFASSVIDVIKREINEEFELFDKENVFYIHGLRKKLADTGKQKKVKKIIADYFTTPTKKKNPRSEPNTRQSGLWRLQVLRNKVTHGHILKSKDRESLKILYAVRQYKSRDEPPFYFEEDVKNPQKYFGLIFSDLRDFAKKTRRVILPKIKP